MDLRSFQAGDNWGWIPHPSAIDSAIIELANEGDVHPKDRDAFTFAVYEALHMGVSLVEECVPGVPVFGVDMVPLGWTHWRLAKNIERAFESERARRNNSAPEALPAGWASAVDPASGKTYYYKGSETSWVKPTA